MLVTQICFAQWYQQNSGTTANLNSVHFEDANNGWAVGDSRIILHTTNGGQEWIAQTSGTDRWLQSVSFTDLNNGTTVGGGENDTTEEGIILRTTNGGMTWFQQTSDTTHNLAGVSFVDSNHGWAVGKYKSIYSGRYTGTILHTTDGGTTWAEQLSDTLFDRRQVNSVSFTDANNGDRCWMEVVGHQSMVQYLERLTAEQTGLCKEAINKVTFYLGYPLQMQITEQLLALQSIEQQTVERPGLYNQSQQAYTLYGVSFIDANNGTAVGDEWNYP